MTEIRIFVITDDQQVAEELSIRLNGLGYRVVGTAATSEQAIQKMGEVKADLLLIDVHQLVDSETKLRAIFDSSRDGMFIYDTAGRCIDVNQAGIAITGRGREEILSASTRVYDLADGAGTSRELPAQQLVRADGSMVWVERTCLPVEMSRAMFTIEVLHDVTRSARAEAELEQAITSLRENEQRFMLAASSARDGLWDWNLQTGKIFFSQRYKAILGYAEDEISDSPDEWFRRVHPDDLLRVKAELADHLGGRSERFESENRMLHKDGRYLWVATRGLALYDVEGVPYRMAGSLSDMDACHNAKEQRDHYALYDALTGLPNRALFYNRLMHAIQRSERKQDNETHYAVLYLDLDQFRIINNSLSHTAGDALLISTAELLQGCLRDVDTVARLGGDEFVILLEDVNNVDAALLVSDRVQEALRTHFLWLGSSQVFVTASMGIVMGDASYRKPEEILRDADIAMYEAKRAGRGKYVVFQPGMRLSSITRLELETDMRLALERNEFFLHYQPILSIPEGRTVGFEALLRWQNPHFGLLPPSEFLPIAEENGMILRIGRWVLQQACRQLAEWKARLPGAADLTVNVNISSQQIHQPGFVEQVDEALRQTGLDPSFLRLEITENILLENTPATLEVIRALRAKGIQLHIDDFGTGYSALSYIQNFPIDTIKIDRSFIEAIGAPGSNLEFIRSILSLASSMGLKTVAEGIETEEQLRELKSLPCPYGQGFYISRPLDVGGVEALLKGTATIHM